MKTFKKITLAFMLLGISGTLAGCTLNEAEEKALLTFEQSAIEYYEAKYGEEAILDSCNYVYTEAGLFFPQRTNSIRAVCTDGTTILYDAESESISDNKQAEQINTALREAFSKRLDNIARDMTAGAFIVESPISFNYNKYLDTCTFRTYYDGNIEEYMKKEGVSLDANLFLCCAREDSWSEAYDALAQMLSESFPGYTWVNLIVLSPECYEKYIAGEYRYPGIDLLDCYAEYQIGSNPRRYIQHYVKLADGIYATAHVSDLILEEGDITLVEAISEDELNQMIYANYEALPDEAEENKNGSYMVEDKAHVNYYTVTAATPIYKVQFSERIKEQFGDELSVYLRFVPEELGLTADNKLYYFPTGGAKTYCNAFCISTNYADAEFNTLRESNYYFGGTQTEVED